MMFKVFNKLKKNNKDNRKVIEANVQVKQKLKRKLKGNNCNCIIFTYNRFEYVCEIPKVLFDKINENQKVTVEFYVNQVDENRAGSFDFKCVKNNYLKSCKWEKHRVQKKNRGRNHVRI